MRGLGLGLFIVWSLGGRLIVRSLGRGLFIVRRLGLSLFIVWGLGCSLFIVWGLRSGFVMRGLGRGFVMRGLGRGFFRLFSFCSIIKWLSMLVLGSLSDVYMCVMILSCDSMGLRVI